MMNKDLQQEARVKDPLAKAAWHALLMQLSVEPRRFDGTLATYHQNIAEGMSHLAKARALVKQAEAEFLI